MNKLVSFAKAIRLKQIFMAFLAGVTLLLNTACSNAAQAQLPGNQKLVDRGPHPVGQTQPYVGGMNNFEDTAPEAQQGGSRAKALVDNAERNIVSNRTKNSPRAKALIDNAGTGISSDSSGKYYDDSLDRAKNRLGNSVKEQTSNVKAEAQKVGDRMSNSLDRAGAKTQELGQRIQKGAEDVKDNVQGGIDGTGYNAKRMSETAKNRGEEAGMDLQETARKVTRAAQDKLSDAADAVKDAIN